MMSLFAYGVTLGQADLNQNQHPLTRSQRYPKQDKAPSTPHQPGRKASDSIESIRKIQEKHSLERRLFL